MSIVVKLSKDEVRLCAMLAVERWLIKYGSADKTSYAHGKITGQLEHNLNAEVRSIAAEWAVAKHFKIAWNVPCYPNSEHPNRKDLPDVGNDGEVRTIRTRNSIPYWAKDKGKIIIACKVTDLNYYSEVEIFGHFEPTFQVDHYHQDEDCYRAPLEDFK